METKMLKEKLELIEMNIEMETYISSNDGDDLIALAKELIKTIEEQQEKIIQLKNYKKALMEASIVRAKAIEELKEKCLLKKEINLIIQWFYIAEDYFSARGIPLSEEEKQLFDKLNKVVSN